jgi:fructokinase
VIVLGEALVDLCVDDRAPAPNGLAMTARAGGSPANVAVGLARLGVSSRFAGRISGDLLGTFLRTHLERSGVDLTLAVDARQPTTVAIVGLDEGGTAAYAFYVEKTADWQWEPTELPANEMGAAIHIGSLAIGLQPGAQVLADWTCAQRKRGVFVSLDPNVRPAVVLERPGYRERLDLLVTQAQLVKVSDEDLRALEPGVDPLDMAREWARRGPELIVLTHGAGGSTALRAGQEPLHCDALAVHVVDTVGAGDAFAAGLIAFLAEAGGLRPGTCAQLDRPALTEALRFAGLVAAITCTRRGADPPYRAELGASALAGPL